MLVLNLPPLRRNLGGNSEDEALRTTRGTVPPEAGVRCSGTFEVKRTNQKGKGHDTRRRSCWTSVAYDLWILFLSEADLAFCLSSRRPRMDGNVCCDSTCQNRLEHVDLSWHYWAGMERTSSDFERTMKRGFEPHAPAYRPRRAQAEHGRWYRR